MTTLTSPTSRFDANSVRAAIVKRCLANPAAQHDDDVSQMRIWAETADILPIHECYWNDRFVEAVVCNFSLPVQRRAAHHVISNGRQGYFEQVTHNGYHTIPAFERLGLSLAGAISAKPGSGTMYFYLNERVLRQLRTKFDLPTGTPVLDLDFYRVAE